MVTRAKATNPDPNPTEETTAIERLISKDQFASITSFEQALELARTTYGELTSSSEFGDGFTMLEDKDKLLNVPLLILDSSVTTSKDFTRNGEPTQFVALRIVTKPGEKFIVIDGGTGVCTQIMEWRTKTGRRGGFVCQKGLRKSEYSYVDDKGDTSPATTYYLDESGT